MNAQAMTLAPGCTEPDEQRDRRLATAARVALQSSGYQVLGVLHCEVRDGRITLTGVVPSFFLKQVAQTVVLQLDPGNGVGNLVEVRAETVGDFQVEHPVAVVPRKRLTAWPS